MVAPVDEDVADLRGEGIDFGFLAEEAVVGGASVFGEIVELEDEGVTGFGEGPHDAGEEGVFAEGGVVEVPDFGVAAEMEAGGVAEAAGERGAVGGSAGDTVVEIGDGDDGEVGAAAAGGSGEDDVFAAGPAEGFRLGLDDAGHASAAEMVMDEGDRHEFIGGSGRGNRGSRPWGAVPPR